jgi:hypothetical protein
MGYRTFLGAAAMAVAAGCASHFADESVTVEGVDKRPAGGYERLAGRKTRLDDKYFQVTIGYKRLAAYGGDTRAAAEAESKRIISSFGYCPRGYQITANPNARTGTYGYFWFIQCND